MDSALSNSPTVPASRGSSGSLQRRVKRIVEAMVAGTGLLVLAPVAALIALLIRVSVGRPVLFRQVRPGVHGDPFTLVKFRTMLDATGPDGLPLPDAARLTRVGTILRKTSLDELPQLWNVLRGDISLVGPRPLLMEYLPLYTADQARRHDVRPGITGWAQVNGRNAIGWEQKFALDVWYVDHWSLRLDFRILVKTIGKVFRREGISGAGEATMAKFTGAEWSVDSQDAAVATRG
jgi:lipopolysaccharide/colanic/teichoic acid biosynthesis glycosyltransferase